LNAYRCATTYGEWLEVMLEYQLPGLAPWFNNHWWGRWKAKVNAHSPIIGPVG
jgi:hypothetical protein